MIIGSLSKQCMDRANIYFALWQNSKQINLIMATKNAQIKNEQNLPKINIDSQN